jgi:hypothetical protein
MNDFWKKLLGRPRELDEELSLQYLDSKSELLRDKLVFLNQGGAAHGEMVALIEGRLNTMKTETNLRQKSNLLELAYEGYITIVPDEELLSVFLGLKSRAYRLDKYYSEIWPKQRLNEIESGIRQGHVSRELRVEVESISKAIYECGFRFTRDNELKSELLRSTLIFDSVAYLILIFLLMSFGFKKVAWDSPYQEILIIWFGVSGGLLSATLQLRASRFYRHMLRTEQVRLLFRAVFGAIAAVIVMLLLDLHFIDFPFLRSGSVDSGALSPSARYVIAFVSGLSERVLLRGMARLVTSRETSDAKEPRKSG